jgi:hypothetical protein
VADRRRPRRVTPWCQACGRSWTSGQVRKSKEHILGDWVKKLEKNHPPEHRSYSGGFEYDESSNALVEIQAEIVQRKAGLLTRQTREICEDCNTGWMSALEDAAKPIIVNLARSAKTGITIPLDYKTRRQLALWAEKTALTDELTSDHLPVGNVGMFQALRAGQPLRGSLVWVARNRADYDIAVALEQIDVSATPVPRPGTTDRRVLLVEIVYHYMTILVFIADSPGQMWPSLLPAAWTMIWPALGQSTAYYPPPSTVRGPEIEAILTKPGQWIPPVRSDIRRSGQPPIVRHRN